VTIANGSKRPPGGRELLTGGNRFKLGLFGYNCSNGLSLTKARTGHEATWDHTLAISKRADEIGLEFLIPIARWKGLGGETNAFGIAYETMTWAAGIAASTSFATVVSTLHLPLTHPIIAAKQCATIDQIAHGRYAFNAVMGWFAPDMRMFGGSMREHEERYRYGEEWTTIVKRIWTTNEPFDFDGEYFSLREVESLPKPYQVPYPLFINAGNSPTGLDFALRNADVNFAIVNNLEMGAKYVADARTQAQQRYGRKPMILSNGFVVCRETEAEARQVAKQMIEDADSGAVRNYMQHFGMGSGSMTAEMRALSDSMVIGMGSPQFIGTPDQVAEALAALAEIGIDGCVFGMLDYYAELPYFARTVLPRLEERGLRTPFDANR
jgi:dimethylsulfone monooxygenase